MTSEGQMPTSGAANVMHRLIWKLGLEYSRWGLGNQAVDFRQ